MSYSLCTRGRGGSTIQGQLADCHMCSRPNPVIRLTHRFGGTGWARHCAQPGFRKKLPRVLPSASSSSVEGQTDKATPRLGCLWFLGHGGAASASVGVPRVEANGPSGCRACEAGGAAVWHPFSTPMLWASPCGTAEGRPGLSPHPHSSSTQPRPGLLFLACPGLCTFAEVALFPEPGVPSLLLASPGPPHPSGPGPGLCSTPLQPQPLVSPQLQAQTGPWGSHFEMEN